jgi:hypothetical protein
MQKFGKRGGTMQGETSCSLPFASVRVSPGAIQPQQQGLESTRNSGALIRNSAPRNRTVNFREVQISLDFIGGQRSIVTFRFSAGDTMMRRRIYASRGM